MTINNDSFGCRFFCAIQLWLSLKSKRVSTSHNQSGRNGKRLYPDRHAQWNKKPDTTQESKIINRIIDRESGFYNWSDI